MVFKKGVGGNPNGRPKGALSATTHKYAKIKNLAVDKYEEAFRLLWEAVEAKEAWAHQLFFKEIMPKKVYQETVSIKPTGGSLEEQIASLREGLAQFTEHTEESVINALKAVSSIKTSENIAEQTATIIESREKLLEKVKDVAKVIDFIKKEEK
jgi:hypothetical protein